MARLLILLLLCVLVSVPDAMAADCAVLKVMTFNIRYGTAPDGENVWSKRRKWVFDVIANAAPDVIGLQEALRFQIGEVLNEFPRYSSVGVGRDADGGGEYSAILYDKHRFDVKQADTFWLSDTETQPGSMTWGNTLPRICTWARLFDRQSGRPFYLFNTHWDHVSQHSRERSGELIRDHLNTLDQRDEPVIVTGDFNVEEGNAAWAPLLRAGLRDSFRVLHPDATEVGTFHAFHGTKSGAKIDAILVSPHWRVEAAEINRTSTAGRYPSDHYPVTTSLSLTGEKRAAKR